MSKPKQPLKPWNSAGWKIGDIATLDFKKEYYYIPVSTYNFSASANFYGAIRLSKPNLVEVVDVGTTWHHITVRLIKEVSFGGMATALESFRFIGKEPMIYLGGDQINMLKPPAEFDKILYQRIADSKKQSAESLKENVELAKPMWKRFISRLYNAIQTHLKARH